MAARGSPAHSGEEPNRQAADAGDRWRLHFRLDRHRARNRTALSASSADPDPSAGARAGAAPRGLGGRALSLADIAVCVQAECIGDSTIGKDVLQSRPALVEYFMRVDALTAADRV